MANDKKRDYYEVLGVKKDASEAELKRAYRKLAKEHHPDLHPGDKTAEQRFKELNEAYEVLSDPEKKTKYDQFGHAGVDPNFAGAGGGFSGFGGFGGFDMEDILNSVNSVFGGGFGFGGESAGQRRSGPSRGANVRSSVTITLQEAAFGCKKDLTITHKAVCDVCKGSGSAEGTTAEVCPDCKGSGSVRIQQRTMFGAMSTTTVCPRCRGEGEIIHQPCSACKGEKYQRKQKKITVTIPAGIDDGQAISLRGQGDAGRKGGAPGDLIVAIHVRPHERLHREGNNIFLEQNISFAQAALGAELEIPTLDGKVKYTIPEGTQTGTTFRLREKGVPNLNGRGRGDQLVMVKVEVPKKMSETQKERLRRFAESFGETGEAEEKGEQKSEPRGFFDKKKKKK